MESDADDNDDHQLRVTRFAVNYEPPTLIVEFRRDGKLFIKKIRIKRLKSDMDAEQLTKSLVKHNYEILNENLVCHDQLQDLVELLLMTHTEDTAVSIANKYEVAKKHLAQADIDENTDANMKPRQCTSPKIKEEEEDLNRVSEEQNQLAKSRMSLQFESNRVLPGSAEFVYDKRVEFEAPSAASGWDEDEEEEEDASPLK